jgi:hypothetical protein
MFAASEFHMTNVSHLFQAMKKPDLWPLYEGKMVHQFDHRFEEPRYWLNEKACRKAVLGAKHDAEQKLDYQDFRLGFRKVAHNTNERTMIATIIPPNFHAENFQSVKTYEGGKRLVSPEVMFYLCAVMNSFTLDYVLRLRVTANVNFFDVYQLPVPRLTAPDAAFGPIVKRAAQLFCTTSEFDALAKEVGLGSHESGVTARAARAKLRAELDGLIAHLYGLIESEFAHILDTFPLVAQPVKDAALEAYRMFAPKSADQQLAADIAKGESATLEFKSSARWDCKLNQASKVLEQVIVKTAAAFMNGEGGTLLIGVDDDGKVLGLEHDYKTLGKKQNREGFENWLTSLLLNEFGKDCAPLLQLAFCQSEGKDVCRVRVKPCSRPAFVKDGNAEHLFIRAGNSTRQLNTKEALDYCKQRWP